MEFTIVTGRTMEQGMFIDEKTSEDYFKAVSYCEMNEEDMKELGVEEGDRVKVITDYGSVVLFVKKAMFDLPRGVIFVPLGPYANKVLPAESGTGTPLFKNIKCRVEKTDEDVPMIDELIKEVIS